MLGMEGEIRQNAFFKFEGAFDATKPEMASVHNPLRLRDGVGNSTIQSALDGLAEHHTLGKEEDAAAFTKLLDCFSPVSAEHTTELTKALPNEHPVTLTDQIGDVFTHYNGLVPEQQQDVIDLTKYLVQSVAGWPQERRIQGVVRPLSPHVHKTADTLLSQMSTWKQQINEALPPEQFKKSEQGSVNPKLAAMITGSGILGLLLAACARVPIPKTPDVGGNPTQNPAITEIIPTLVPTEYILPGVTTETSTVPTQVVMETPPAQIEGIMVLPGIEPSAGGPDLIKNPYSTALRDVINAAKFGLVSGENVSVKTGQTCISNVPEKLWHDTLPKNEQLWKETVNGVATYVDQQVLAEVPIPADTKDATYSCALGYTKDNGEYIDGTLFQLLIKTNTADGSQEVIATMKAGFSTEDTVEVKNGAVLVNGETQGWTAREGMELPAATTEFKAGIPATMEECNKLELQYKPDGTIDREWLSTQMKELSKVEHQWLADQGITPADVSVFNLGNQQKIAGNEMLPFPFLTLRMEKFTPTSCTSITYKGSEYMIYGFAGIRTPDSTIIGIPHVLYDYKGRQSTFAALGLSDSYDKKFTPELVFSGAQLNKIQEISIFLERYGQNADQTVLDRWDISKELAELNNPTGDRNLDSDEKFVMYIDPTITITSEEEKQWIAQIEQFVFPSDTITPGL